jgi:hypothetical protein
MPTLQEIAASASRPRRSTLGTVMEGARGGELRAYEPGVMDNVRNFAINALAPLFGGDVRAANAYYRDKIQPTAEFLPGVGDVMAAGEARDAFGQGDYLGGSLLAAGAAAGLVPGVGDVVQKGISKGAKSLRYGDPTIEGIRRQDKPVGSEGEVMWTALSTKKHRPLDEMSETVEDLDELLPRQIVSPEDLQGSVLIPAVGDRSLAGGMLTAINDVNLPNAVHLQGGADFMRGPQQATDGATWASDAGVISGILNNARKSSEMYGGLPVNKVYSAMGPRSVDFNTMTSDAVMEQIRAGGGVDPKAAQVFNEAMRNKVDPKWGDINDIDAAKQALRNMPGARRTIFEKLVENSNIVDPKSGAKFDMRSSGFPEMASTRAATMDPALRYAPEGATGRTISSVDLDNSIIQDPRVPHATYGTQMRGEYMGGFEQDLPREVVFPGFFANRRAQGIDPYGDRRSFEISHVNQLADQEWLDRVMQYMERQKALGGQQ